MTSNWLFANAALLELTGLYTLLGGSQSAAVLLAFTTLHAGACASLTAGLWPLLPGCYRTPRHWSLTFLFSVAFFIPGFGVLGVALAVVPALHFPRRQIGAVWKPTAIPELPFRATELDLRSVQTAGGLHDVLRHAVNPDRRLSAILSTRRMDQRAAIPILKLALKDPVDDVRLLAYSMLDSKENDINQKIRALQDELREADPEQQPALHAALARQYWELVYLGLAQGSVLEHMLTSARRHIEQAIAARHVAEDWLLLGRVALEQGCAAEAERLLARAEELGMSPAQLASYRAEAAFAQRRFGDIAGCLAQLNPEDRQRQQFSALMRYWQPI